MVTVKVISQTSLLITFCTSSFSHLQVLGQHPSVPPHDLWQVRGRGPFLHTPLVSIWFPRGGFSPQHSWTACPCSSFSLKRPDFQLQDVSEVSCPCETLFFPWVLARRKVLGFLHPEDRDRSSQGKACCSREPPRTGESVQFPASLKCIENGALSVINVPFVSTCLLFHLVSQLAGGENRSAMIGPP